MSNVYCTLFDSYYLSRGCVMLESLIAHGNAKDRIYVFCFDAHTFDVLEKTKYPKVIPIPLAEFETADLLKVKPTRNKGEYCWTCTPHTLLHVLEKRGEVECTYIDADLYFYQNPSILFPKENSVLITEHRYTPEYDQTATSGRFCVQFVTFKKEPRAMELLQEWGSQCLEWCYDRFEDGKFGDQKYLDAWPSKGSFVEIASHPGAGLAPWNIQQVNEKQVDPVFYHFHALRVQTDGWATLGNYRLQKWTRERFYLPYLRRLIAKDAELLGHDQIPLSRTQPPANKWKYRLKRLLQPYKFIRISRGLS